MPLDSLTASYLSGLAAALTTQLLNGTGKRAGKLFSTPEKEKALKRCVHKAVVGMSATASAAVESDQ